MIRQTHTYQCTRQPSPLSRHSWMNLMLSLKCLVLWGEKKERSDISLLYSTYDEKKNPPEVSWKGLRVPQLQNHGHPVWGWSGLSFRRRHTQRGGLGTAAHLLGFSEFLCEESLKHRVATDWYVCVGGWFLPSPGVSWGPWMFGSMLVTPHWWSTHQLRTYRASEAKKAPVSFRLPGAKR